MSERSSSEVPPLRYEVENGRARLTLDRPEKRNALSFELLQQLHDALWRADDDTRVHVIVIRGAGSCFSAGYDLSGMGSPGPDAGSRRGSEALDDDIWQLERAQRLRMAIFDVHKPVIAQVHGHCLAGGTDVALLCDLVIAADDAVFGFPPARDLGSLPTQMWLYHVGPQWAKRLLLTGDTITGREAASIGLVLKAVPQRHLEAEVEGLADRMARIDPHLLAVNKRVLNVGLELMGARTLQRLAAEYDGRGHRTAAARGFVETVRREGLKEAFRRRDDGFGDGRARVDGPELRDEEGRLLDPSGEP
ncbi:MAG TPA: crotonase/enoyl-CoA hydratase family protein [Thermoanaerobaculia bacterium]|nr:crotonase/enoyl-CoA hydratase family protein [Thermoanaerobaculia bacterium]